MKLSEFTHPLLHSRLVVAALVIMVVVTAVSSCSDDGDEHQMPSMSDETADPHACHDMEGAASSPQMSPVDHSQHSDPLKQKAQSGAAQCTRTFKGMVLGNVHYAGWISFPSRRRNPVTWI